MLLSMQSLKPHVVVFFGGHAGNADLSSQSALWFGTYVPRGKYQVTPVQIMPDGTWKVPLGSLPKTGPIQAMWQRLFEAIRPLSPAKALERLMSRPIDLLMTFVRGKGGDDGSLHLLGQTLQLPVFGSPASVAQIASNKHLSMQTIGDMTGVPFTKLYKPHMPAEEIVDDMTGYGLPHSFFVKPLIEEGSFGIVKAQGKQGLLEAIGQTRERGDFVIQEDIPGTELSVTLYEDALGRLQALPATIIVPKKAAFYDHLAKRRAGRALLHTPNSQDNVVIAEAESIARDIWAQLGCRDIASFDMVAGKDAVDVLEVNTVPTFTSATPPIGQFKAGAIHPTRLFDSMIRRRLL